MGRATTSVWVELLVSGGARTGARHQATVPTDDFDAIAEEVDRGIQHCRRQLARLAAVEDSEVLEASPEIRVEVR